MEELLEQLLVLVEKKVPKKKLLIIQTSSQLHEERVAELLAKHATAVALSVWKSNEYDSDTTIHPYKDGTIIGSKEHFIKQLTEANLVLIPSMSRDLLVKGALCMSDTSSAWALQLALMQKKSILALEGETNLQSEQARFQGINKNSIYEQTLMLYHDQLINLGVGIVSIFDFPTVLSRLLDGTVVADSQVKKDDHLPSH